MARAIGGDIVEVTFNHPSVGTGTFSPKAGEDSTYDLGGLRSDDDANGITGAGEAIRKMNKARWSFEVVCASDMNTAEDLEKITSLSNSPAEADWTITHTNGSVYKGKGFPVGDIQGNGNAATFTLKVAGGGEMKKIA